MKINTLFLGSDWESLETLKALNEDSRFNIIGVITPEDKPIGRDQEIQPSKVKLYAIENNIPVFHTNKNKGKYAEALELFKPELVVCKAFGEIVPKFFLDYPKYKCINVHFSILPQYRGAVPIQKAILNGDTKTGISIMLMSEGLDEGDVLKIFEEDIMTDDTNQSLRERLVKKSAEVLGDVLENWVNGKITAKPQNDSLATFCWQKDISKEKALIDWENEDSDYIERKIRAFIPWPIAWTILDKNEDIRLKNKRLKIFKAKVVDMKTTFDPGVIFTLEGKVYLPTRDGKCLNILELQLEGKNKMTEKEYVNGFGE